ncbi:hypothetical protein SAMN04489724_2562 [Algoriphagus locisalis]|uniref:Uncharacterized protein n=1 Tax=Algoriphagus locisalis TaxID=305507 RepID=A0A1I7BNA2_9BACT|nr:hypothetical protein [Algoriphagus locisalis]SFT88639.1 hypothetical protein SAMN04489724_2562 [Algoriphagus locisalis]
MIKLHYLILCCALFSFACNSEDEDFEPTAACGVNDAISDLPWLKAKYEGLSTGELSEYSYLVQAELEGETVFYMGSCCPFCNWAIILYDCAGNSVEYNATEDELVDGKVIWQPENSVCQF